MEGRAETRDYGNFEPIAAQVVPTDNASPKMTAVRREFNAIKDEMIAGDDPNIQKLLLNDKSIFLDPSMTDKKLNDLMTPIFTRYTA